ncbi:MAE_28990/MAE_18760 family HEPN-like nuclease [Plantibacter sp. M259]|uniref:MAE_28990/MAE_18760 family HEPN-like nuclease n=1 Tax=Plantibacter sp. M259 TaxID=2583822 RepID=UPI001110E451|nr:MAE_28990/MAE_18760 family HEPN-like nuclease [Plantibacter sp. M259]
MISVAPHRQALKERIDVVISLIDETHPAPLGNGPISREARGLAIVLLFAAYEELLRSLTRTILEAVVRLRISNSRLQPGLRSFALRNLTKSLRAVGERKVFGAIPSLIETLGRTDREPTVNPDDFPDDGSFMKQSQVELWARTFDVGHPGALLKKVWNRIDTVVVQRNKIAHGDLTPQDVGRGYSEREIRELIDSWYSDWDNFLLHVEKCASTRDFFRVPR